MPPMTEATATAPTDSKAARGAATRRRLLDATIEALVEVGWSGTSTTEVVRRAGVSRGAQVHHYPTKSDLVLAAIEHLLLRRLDEFHDTFDRLPPERRTIPAAFDLLWQAARGPTFDAWLELAVAARRDPTLHQRFVEVERRFWDANVERFRAQFADLFSEGDDDPAAVGVALRLAFSVVDGLAISRMIGVTDQELDATREAFLALVAPHLPDAHGGTP